MNVENGGIEKVMASMTGNKQDALRFDKLTGKTAELARSAKAAAEELVGRRVGTWIGVYPTYEMAAAIMGASPYAPLGEMRRKMKELADADEDLGLSVAGMVAARTETRGQRFAGYYEVEVLAEMTEVGRQELFAKLRAVGVRVLRTAEEMEAAESSPSCSRTPRSAVSIRDDVQGLDLWTRQVGRRQVSSITLAGGHAGIDRARSLRATAGSTGHRYCCSHCPTIEKNSTPHCQVIRS